MDDIDKLDVKPEDKGKELSFITVIGRDQQGIVARVSSLLFEHKINIEDIAQRVMEGHFVMIMLVDFKDSPSDLEDVKASLEKVGGEMNLRIQIQHENLFKMMHRV
ncbi:MAG: ACT domain-containing protein [Gemmatimonadota bacterium]|nr:ACT domain-containing protein [Gemmatimonadota bacterium]